MSRWFYAAWAIAVLAAVILPIAIPYAIWPAGATSPCELHTLVPLSSETPFAVVNVPLEITGERCVGDATDPIAGKVIVHGAYGIPIASATLEYGSYDSLLPDDGVVLATLALIMGVLWVSLPFIFILLIRQRDDHSATARRDSSLEPRASNT